LSETFNLPVGLSDHTMGSAVAVAAVALGACIIEKHLTLSRSVPGPDSSFSMEPHEFKEMVEAVRTAQKALGKVNYGVNENEKKNRTFRRSLFVVKDMQAGENFTTENLRSIRPGNGLQTRYLDFVLGKKAIIKIDRGTPLSWNIIE
jgi:sialic acid synthase SpsE